MPEFHMPLFLTMPLYVKRIVWIFLCIFYHLWIRKQQALPRDAAMEDMNIRNRYLEERLQSLESQLAKEPLSRPSVRIPTFFLCPISSHISNGTPAIVTVLHICIFILSLGTSDLLTN